MAGDKLHWIQVGLFTYSACCEFNKHRERIQKLLRRVYLNHIYKNRLDKTCFAPDAAYSDKNDSGNRTVSDKVLRDRAYEIATNSICDGYERGLASMAYKFLTRRQGLGAITTSKAKARVNEKPAQILYTPVIKKFKRRKDYAKSKDNVWAADLVEMGSQSSFYHGVKYLLCVIDVFTKHAWVKPWKIKKGKTVFHGLNYGLIKKENFIITLSKKG